MTDFNNLYKNCMLCPRRCGVNRLDNNERLSRSGYCGESAALRLSSASIHLGEEPPISGKNGSGTLFVSGCNLGCKFCQNHQISRSIAAGTAPMGREVSTAEFAEICLALEKNGAENINIVTGSHAIPAIAAGIDVSRAAGMHIPIVWNTSSFESIQALELLRSRVALFLPDLKTLDPRLALAFFNAPAYPQAAAAAILKMLELGGRVIIRHLILPGLLESTRDVLRWFADNAADRAALSLMTQYTPPAEPEAAGRPQEAAVPRRYTSDAEFDTVLGWLEEFGIDDGYCQEPASGSSLSERSEWLPDFSRINPFPSELSKPVWHWREGFCSSL